MKKKLLTIMACGLFAFTGVSTANATLIKVGTASVSGSTYEINVIWDQENAFNGKSNVWLDYKSQYGDHWDTQMQWASNLGGNVVLDIAPEYNISWTDPEWRLFEATSSTEMSTSPIASEMAALVADTDWGFDTFKNVRSGSFWSGTENLLNTDSAMGFQLSGTKKTDTWAKYYYLGATPVRSADITLVSMDAPAPVPEPATMLLLGTGLVGLAGGSKFKKRKKA